MNAKQGANSCCCYTIEKGNLRNTEKDRWLCVHKHEAHSHFVFVRINHQMNGYSALGKKIQVLAHARQLSWWVRWCYRRRRASNPGKGALLPNGFMAGHLRDRVKIPTA